MLKMATRAVRSTSSRGEEYPAGLIDPNLTFGGNGGNTAEACEDSNSLVGYSLV